MGSAMSIPYMERIDLLMFENRNASEIRDGSEELERSKKPIPEDGGMWQR